MKWQDISVDIKTLSPVGCLTLPGAICMYKTMKKKWYKIKTSKRFIFYLVANDRSDKPFLLTSFFCPLGLSAPDLRLYTFIKSWKAV